MIDILYDEKNLRDLRVYVTTSLRDLRETLYDGQNLHDHGKRPKMSEAKKSVSNPLKSVFHKVTTGKICAICVSTLRRVCAMCGKRPKMSEAKKSVSNPLKSVFHKVTTGKIPNQNPLFSCARLIAPSSTANPSAN